MTIKRRINQLIPPKTRGKKRLAPISSTRRIAAGIGIGKKTAPLPLRTERRTLLSSDGIFSLDYYHVLGVSGS